MSSKPHGSAAVRLVRTPESAERFSVYPALRQLGAERLPDAGRAALRAALREPLAELHYAAAFVGTAAAGPDPEEVAERLLRFAADVPRILDAAEAAAVAALRAK
jgi:hypothetical protein